MTWFMSRLSSEQIMTWFMSRLPPGQIVNRVGALRRRSNSSSMHFVHMCSAHGGMVRFVALAWLCGVWGVGELTHVARACLEFWALGSWHMLLAHACSLDCMLAGVLYVGAESCTFAVECSLSFAAWLLLLLTTATTTTRRHHSCPNGFAYCAHRYMQF